MNLEGAALTKYHRLAATIWPEAEGGLLANDVPYTSIFMCGAGGVYGNEIYGCASSSVLVVLRLRAKPETSNAAECTAGTIAHHPQRKRLVCSDRRGRGRSYGRTSQLEGRKREPLCRPADQSSAVLEQARTGQVQGRA